MTQSGSKSKTSKHSDSTQYVENSYKQRYYMAMKEIRYPALPISGLSGSTIKYIGLVMMVFDHLYQMFGSQGIPQWFHWIGRPVLPVFLFACVEAFWYTRSRSKYMLRLFIGFELMNIASLALSNYLPVDNVELANNVFQTLLLAALYMLFIEMLKAGIREKHILKTAAAIVLILLPIAVGVLLLFLLPAFPYWLKVFCLFIPNLLFTEGGFTAVILGVLFYLFRKKRLIQVLIIAAFSILSIILTLTRGANLFSDNPQWLLIFAIILILLYNGKRGQGNKYFFYIFYPAHIYLFYICAWVIVTHGTSHA